MRDSDSGAARSVCLRDTYEIVPTAVPLLCEGRRIEFATSRKNRQAQECDNDLGAARALWWRRPQPTCWHGLLAGHSVTLFGPAPRFCPTEICVRCVTFEIGIEIFLRLIYDRFNGRAPKVQVNMLRNFSAVGRREGTASERETIDSMPWPRVQEASICSEREKLQINTPLTMRFYCV